MRQAQLKIVKLSRNTFQINLKNKGFVCKAKDIVEAIEKASRYLQLEKAKINELKGA